MANNRDAFHSKLEKIVPNVIYNASENDKIKYPCIAYRISFADNKFADNKAYSNHIAYEVTLMTINATDEMPLIEKFFEEFTMVALKNTFVTEGIAHTVFTIYNTL